MSLEGKVAFVTGAGSGICRSIALVLAGRGADIVAIGRRREPLEETIAEVRKLGRRGLAVPTDVTVSEQVRNAVRQSVDEFGRVDILVNGAGNIVQKPVEQTTDADWQCLLDTHLNGAFYCAREIVPLMKKQGGGKIINIASIAAQIGRVDRVCYSTAKAGLLGFTKALAKEVAPYKINVNAISPGSVMTPMLRLNTAENLRERIERIPLHRFAEPDELGYLAAYLASKEADYITGQVIGINGGDGIVGI